MNDELENQLRALGSAITDQLDAATVVARRESAVRSAMTARQIAAAEPRLSLGKWIADLLRPGALAPSAALCLLLLGIVFVFQESPSPSSMISSVPVARIDSAGADEGADELAEEISLVGASLIGEFEAEFESDGGEDEESVETLSFSEDDFDTEEDFAGEYGTETI